MCTKTRYCPQTAVFVPSKSDVSPQKTMFLPGFFFRAFFFCTSVQKAIFGPQNNVWPQELYFAPKTVFGPSKSDVPTPKTKIIFLTFYFFLSSFFLHTCIVSDIWPLTLRLASKTVFASRKSDSCPETREPMFSFLFVFVYLLHTSS